MAPLNFLYQTTEMGEVDDITCSIRAEETNQRGQERTERPRRAADCAHSPVLCNQMQILKESTFYLLHTLLCLSLGSNSLAQSSPHPVPSTPTPWLLCFSVAVLLTSCKTKPRLVVLAPRPVVPHHRVGEEGPACPWASALPTAPPTCPQGSISGAFLNFSTSSRCA